MDETAQNFALFPADLIAQLGVWKTLSAVLGGFLKIVLFLAIREQLTAATGADACRQVRRRFR